MYFASEKVTLLPEPSPAKVDEVVGDRIRICWNATYWDAYVYVPNSSSLPVDISPEQSVTVVGIKGIKLIVLF